MDAAVPHLASSQNYVIDGPQYFCGRKEDIRIDQEALDSIYDESDWQASRNVEDGTHLVSKKSNLDSRVS